MPSSGVHSLSYRTVPPCPPALVATSPKVRRSGPRFYIVRRARNLDDRELNGPHRGQVAPRRTRPSPRPRHRTPCPAPARRPAAHPPPTPPPPAPPPVSGARPTSGRSHLTDAPATGTRRNGPEPPQPQINQAGDTT